MDRFDIAVVGLGPIGAGALRATAASGGSVVGIGSPEPTVFASHDGPFASHYDSGRVTRHVDATFEWAELARRAIADYPEIASRSGVEFHRPVGVVYAARGPDQIAAVDAVVARLAALRIEVARRSRVDDDRIAIVDGAVCFVEGAPAGHIDPRRMTTAQIACAVADRATVRRTVVTAIEPAASGWRIHLAGGDAVEAACVVVAGGPHSGELAGLPSVPPVRVRPEVVLTGVVDEVERGRLAGLPSVLAPVDDATFGDVYVVPPTDYPDGTMRIKLGASRHTPLALPDAASLKAWMRGDEHVADLALLQRLIESLIPGLRVEHWETKPCLITDTPTGLPYVDHLADGLVFAAGCNGYAAKSGDAIGALAARLALSGAWSDPVLTQSKFANRPATTRA
jgi:glycine/D-amino acid oxidase-like deaminating enzyme